MAQTQNFGYKVLAFDGNLPMYTGGLAVWSTPSTPFQKSVPLVAAGQGVVFDPMRNISLTLADILTRDKVAIGVGVGPIVGGPSTSMRLTSFDVVDLCNITRASAEPPRCPGVPRVRVLFECLTCYDDVAIKVRWRNNDTENNLDMNQWDQYTHYAKQICSSCGACNPADVSDAVACLLVQSGEDQPYKYGKEGSWGYLPKPALPYTMRRIRANETTTQWCLNPTANACANCIVIPAITGISINGVITNFTGTVDPSNPNQSFLIQLEWVKDQANAALAASGGRASIETGAEENTCCPAKLNISSCHPIQLLGAGGIPIASCSTINPNLTVPFTAQCADCTIPPATRTFTAGVEIEFHLDPNKCSCYPDLQGKSNYSIEYDIEVLGIPAGSYTIVEDQAVVYPENFGFQWLVKEFGQEVGGVGREESYYDTYSAWYGQPMKDSKQLALMTNCDSPYCSFHLEHSIEQSNISVHGDVYKPRWGSSFLIKSAHTVTLDSFQQYFNAILNARTCPVKTAVYCWDAGNALIVDQDQDETQPNFSGSKLGE